MKKQCKKTGLEFELTDQDLEFYKKFNVPTPKYSPLYRMQQLMCFRNERNLYKSKCAFSNKNILSIYPPDTEYKIYDQKIWWSDKWDSMDYGQDFDFERSFFSQFEELNKKVPRINLGNRNNENSEYCNDSNDLKNCYLCINIAEAQDCSYCSTGAYSRDCIDTFWCLACELCYECTKVMESYRCFWCFNSVNLSDCYFCEECVGCKNCFACVGLRQKEYCVYNKQISKDEYEKFIKNIDFSNSFIKETERELSKLWLKIPHKNLQIIQSENSIGDYISNSKNCTECFDAINSEDCRYVWDGLLNDSYSSFNCGGDIKNGRCSFIYYSLASYYSNNLKFCNKCSKSSDLIYCDSCFQCDSCFGSVGLRHKKYCILNKQYTKEEYERFVGKIIEYMNKTEEYGEFFPIKISPFGYNDSMALYYFSLSREEAIEKGFNWNDYKKPESDMDSIEANELPDKIEDTDDSILGDGIKCTECRKLFKIIPQEFKKYKKWKISLPHLCPDCRYFSRKKKMNPRKLWDRECSKCKTKIRTTYAPDRAEIVYCEKCYLSEIY